MFLQVCIQVGHIRETRNAVTCAPSQCITERDFYADCPRAANAIFMTPSSVLLPPMKPLACTNTQPSIPVNLLSSSSRMPRQASGSGFLDSNDTGDTLTACTNLCARLCSRHCQCSASNASAMKLFRTNSSLLTYSTVLPYLVSF
jgi:hypothetical protein